MVKRCYSIVILLFLAFFTLSCRRGPESSVPRMAEGVIDTGDSLSLGLRRRESAQWTEVYRSEGYVNNAVITRFKGRYYCMWQQSERDEDHYRSLAFEGHDHNETCWASRLAILMEYILGN